jgi:leucyl-tRNA synthetase
MPHAAEEMWVITGHQPSIFDTPWPEYDENYITVSTIELAIQINGKLRGTLAISKDAEREEILKEARSVQNVKKYLEGKNLIKEILVPGRLVNFVVKG